MYNVTATGVYDIFIGKYGTYIWNSIAEANTNNPISLLLYPTPATNKLSVRSNQYEIKSFQIIDLLGKNIFQSDITDKQSTIETDVSNLTQGIYFCKLSTANGMPVKKFVNG